MTCTGQGDIDGDHCCSVAGERCRYLVENVDGRRWACGLRATLGSWEEVHAHPGYIEHVQSEWDRLGVRDDGTPYVESCGTWGEGSGQCCYKDNGQPVSVVQ